MKTAKSFRAGPTKSASLFNRLSVVQMLSFHVFSFFLVSWGDDTEYTPHKVGTNFADKRRSV
jgi:hypothetical protein